MPVVAAIFGVETAMVAAQSGENRGGGRCELTPPWAITGTCRAAGTWGWRPYSGGAAGGHLTEKGRSMLSKTVLGARLTKSSAFLFALQPNDDVNIQ